MSRYCICKEKIIMYKFIVYKISVILILLIIISIIEGVDNVTQYASYDSIVSETNISFLVPKFTKSLRIELEISGETRKIVKLTEYEYRSMISKNYNNIIDDSAFCCH